MHVCGESRVMLLMFLSKIIKKDVGETFVAYMEYLS